MSVAEAFFGIEIWKGTKLLESERYTYIKSAHLLTNLEANGCNRGNA